MKFRRLTWDEEHPIYNYHFCDGKTVSIQPGDKSPIDGRGITNEDIKVLISCHNAEVRNNIKNCKAPLTERAKKDIRDWEEGHPGEKAPNKWNASLDCIMEDHTDTDCSSIMLKAYKSTHEDNPAADRLWELIDQMTETQRRALIMSRLEKRPLKEIAKMLGCSVSAVSRAVKRAEDFIKRNYHM